MKCDYCGDKLPCFNRCDVDMSLEKDDKFPPNYYAKLSLEDKLNVAVTFKHFSLESGCDAHVEIFHKLIPEAIRTLKEHSALLAEKDKEIIKLKSLLELNVRCLEIQSHELSSVVCEIDQDIFENWDDGRKSLKGIYQRLKIAIKNAREALKEL